MTAPFEEFAAGLRGRIGVASPVENLVVWSSIDSTNRLARAIQRQVLEDEQPARRTAIVAWDQFAGRGRFERRWESDRGGAVLASITSVCPVEQIGWIPLAVASTLCETLVASGLDVGLKWPNDLVMPGGEKLGGILVESVRRGDGPCYLVVGFGINVRPIERAELGRATSIQEQSSELPSEPLDAVAARLIDEVAGALTAIEGGVDRETRARLVASYAARLVHAPGERLRVRVGSEWVDGTFAGVDDDGRLRLTNEGGERRVDAGEIVESGADREAPGGPKGEAG